MRFPPTTSPTPHLDEELRLSELVARLSYADCELFYPHLKQAAPPQAREVVAAFLTRKESTRQSKVKDSRACAGTMSTP